MSNSLWHQGMQHARLLCPSLSPRVCSDSCLLSQWCHPTISSSAACFSFCLQSFPAPESFWMSCLFTSGGWSIGALASASVLSMKNQCWFPLGLTSLIALLSTGLFRVFSNIKFKSINFLMLSFLYGLTLTSIHDYWKNHSFVGQVMALLFSILSTPL